MVSQVGSYLAHEDAKAHLEGVLSHSLAGMDESLCLFEDTGVASCDNVVESHGGRFVRGAPTNHRLVAMSHRKHLVGCLSPYPLVRRLGLILVVTQRGSEHLTPQARSGNLREIHGETEVLELAGAEV